MAVLCLLFCAVAGVITGVASEITPVVYPVNTPSQCGLVDPFQNDQLLNSIASVENMIPFYTCKDVLRRNPSATSGYYMIQAINGSSVQVYCDMEGTNCGGEGGWMRVAYLDMTDPSNQCPENFQVMTFGGTRFCIRDITTGGCRGIQIQTFNLSYSQMCGYVRGYDKHSVDGFGYRLGMPLTSDYVDGVSITYGSPPTHVWTYVAGLEEDAGSHPPSSCPCNSNINIDNIIPPYVGNDYYCEAGKDSHPSNTWHTGDALWDGQQCGGTEGPCCNIPGLPWFNKKYIPSIAEDIEVRLCVDQHNGDENLGIDKLELYIR